MRTSYKVILLMALILYIAGSLASASFIITHWDAYTRASVAIFLVFCSITCLLGAWLEGEKPKDDRRNGFKR